MGWTSSENLVCILEEGTMVVYDLRGEQVFARVIARVSFSMAIRIKKNCTNVHVHALTILWLHL